MKCLLLLSLLAAVAHGAAPASCKGQPNTIPVYEDDPTFVSSTSHGVRYEVGPADMSPKLAVVHVFGTPYEMGEAYGALMKDEINELIPEVLEYIYSQMDEYLQFLPPTVRHQVERYGVEVALNLTFEFTKAHIPQHYFETVQGMANSTGISWEQLMRIALFPELIKAHCSMFGAWGEATANTSSSLVQLRALDWTTNGPFQKFPLLLTYHPAAGYGHTFAALTWAGLVGAITGWSSANIGVSEKVWLNYKGPYSPMGYPWHFLLQDILQFDIDTDQALSRIASANRTCSIFVGIGDYENMQFRALEYSHTTVNIYNDRNFPAYENHDRFKDLVFIDKHTQPSHDPCLNDLMHQYYGSIDPVNTLRYITAQFQTGDMHVAIYDFANMDMYVANASPMVGNDSSTVIPAYNRPFIKVDMAKLFAVAPVAN